jgi:hypothetical protein
MLQKSPLDSSPIDLSYREDIASIDGAGRPTLEALSRVDGRNKFEQVRPRRDATMPCRLAAGLFSGQDATRES